MNFDFGVTPLYRKNLFDKIKVDKFSPLVSIVTPFYNSGKYINDTAVCVLNQTFPWFEWIIVDDGSKDETSLKILDDLEKKADEAIEQIEDRKYDMELRSEGYKNIFKYGIAFYKKDCLIKIKD